MNLKHVLGWAAVTFVMWWIIVAPHDATQIVQHIGNFISTSARGFSHFVQSI